MLALKFNHVFSLVFIFWKIVLNNIFFVSQYQVPTFLPATQRASVREDSAAGAVVLRMNASDDDAQGEGEGSGLVRSISCSSCEKIVLTDHEHMSNATASNNRQWLYCFGSEKFPLNFASISPPPLKFNNA